MTRTWTDERTCRLGDLINDGLTVDAAAAMLQLSRGSVSGRTHRLGWKFSRPLSEEQRRPPFKVVRAGLSKKARAALPPRDPRDAMVGTSVRFDPETYGQIGAFAQRGGVSLAQAIRELVEWGLEDSAGGDR